MLIKKTPSLSLFKNLEGIADLAVELVDVNKDMSRTSSFQGFREENDEAEEKAKNLIKRHSKYLGMTKGTKINEQGYIVSDNKRVINAKLNTVIKFRSKAKDKNRNSDQAVLNQLEARELEENIDIEVRKKQSLPGKLKMLFHQFKIGDLNTPDKLENHVNEKFKRDKSDVTMVFAVLDEEIRGEMYSDKEKLKRNIFEDFEKQESWQSYTTLLFADISTLDQKKSNRTIKA